MQKTETRNHGNTERKRRLRASGGPSSRAGVSAI
jgi:hypothetical protein